MNEIIAFKSDIAFKPCVIDFPDFEVFEQQAYRIADEIDKIEVNEDNIKLVKKDLATIRKGINTLDNRRKEIKKEVIKPLTAFENQVKQLIQIISDAESVVRDQTRKLEENEREERFKVVLDLFNKRNAIYNFEFVTVENFITPQHLNKGTSTNKVELEMVDWFEKIKRDLDAITVLDEEDDVLAYYIDCLDLTTAISQVNKQKQMKDQAERIMSQSKPVERVVQKQVTIYLGNQEDLIKVIGFMNNEGIKYNLK